MTAKQIPNEIVVRTRWPKESEIKFSELGSIMDLEDQVRELRSDWNGLLALGSAPAPIVGVLGLLNAGKSSLVSSFLSQKGAKRVLRGIDEDCGTQRFVFWLPAKWKGNATVWRAFRDELDAVFDGRHEFLDEDPERAQAQYNGDGATADRFPVPLIAFDPFLDELGFGFLDCPDFERKHPGIDSQRSADVRMDFVRRAAKLMSAVAVVADNSKASAAYLANCANPKMGLKEKKRFILLNYVRPSEGVTKLLEKKADLLSEFNVDKLFAAYDWEMDGADALIPSVGSSSNHGGRTPLFFEVSSDDSKNARDAVDEDRLIHRHLQKLEPTEIWARKREAQADQIIDQIEGIKSDTEKRLSEQEERIEGRRQGLLDFVRTRVTRREGGKENLLFPVPPDVSKQLIETISRTAPWWAKPAMWTLSAAKGAKELVEGFKAGWKLMNEPSDVAKKQAKEKIEYLKNQGEFKFLGDHHEWATECMNHKFMPDDLDEEIVKDCWEKALDVAVKQEVQLDEVALWEFGMELWSSIPTYKKVKIAVTGPALLLAALAVIIIGAVDGGAGAVLFTYSLPQFFAALGLGFLAPVAAGAGGKQLEDQLVVRAGIPFYMNLLKATLDLFGLPRGSNLNDHFDNTGKLSVSLQPEEGEKPLKPLLPLCGSDVLGVIDSEGWDAMKERVWSDANPKNTQ